MFLDSVLEQRYRMKILSSRTVNLSRTMACNLSRSRTQLLFTLFLTVSVVSFLASSSLPDVSSSAAAKFASGLFSASSYISSFSARTSINASLAPNDDDDNCTTTATAAADCASSASISVVTTVERIMPRDSRNASSWSVLNDDLSSCDIFDGNWVADHDFDPPYQPGSCPFVDNAFNCFKNGRPDSGFLNFRWKPHGCHLPRLDGRKMLRILRGKRLVFVGDSLNRNMWESLVCALGAYPWMMKALESVISEMKTPVLYMNITKMTEYRKDGHPSAYRKPEKQKSPMPMMIQDCSHWCLPGIPDSWNELLYTSLLISDQDSGSQESV